MLFNVIVKYDSSITIFLFPFFVELRMSIFSIPKYYLSGKYELLMNDMQNKMKQLMI